MTFLNRESQLTKAQDETFRLQGSSRYYEWRTREKRVAPTPRQRTSSPIAYINQPIFIVHHYPMPNLSSKEERTLRYELYEIQRMRRRKGNSRDSSRSEKLDDQRNLLHQLALSTTNRPKICPLQNFPPYIPTFPS